MRDNFMTENLIVLLCSKFCINLSQKVCNFNFLFGNQKILQTEVRHFFVLFNSSCKKWFAIEVACILILFIFMYYKVQKPNLSIATHTTTRREKISNIFAALSN